LRDRATSPFPSERLLQQIWFHQRLQRDALRTLDGRPLTILHPGFWNHAAGPDFRQAVLQFGDDAPCSGDVEVDLRAAAWHQHGHDRNPTYTQVRLHVIWQGASPEAAGVELPPPRPVAGAAEILPARGAGSLPAHGPLPTLALADVLDAPLEELREWLGDEATQGLLTARTGACAPPLEQLPATGLPTLLEQAAFTRLRLKADQLAARARQAGWGQALWEAAFGALGYKHNVWPLRRLAELREPLLRDLPCDRAAAPELQARLFGLAGLLPDQLTRRWPATDAWLRRAWDIWWRWRESAGPVGLPRNLWRFDGLRPANHPQRRLALAAHWLADPDWPARSERWLATELADTALRPALLAELQPPEDEFWDRHWTLNSRPMARPRPLLGEARITDLAMNAILPWLWSRARAADNAALRTRIEHRYRSWPAAADNALLRLARQRLLGGRALPPPTRAIHQQGLLQIVRDFCDHANALCDDCQFPQLVWPWTTGSADSGA
jgi:hypothetical protein